MTGDSGVAPAGAIAHVLTTSTGFPDVWIDATRAASAWQVWGMSLVERQVREASLRGSATIIVWTTPATAAAVGRMRSDLRRLYAPPVQCRSVESIQELYQALEQTDVPVLLLEGDVVYDDRILSHLADVGPDSVVETEERVAAVHLSPAGGRRLAAACRRVGGWRAGSLAAAAATAGTRTYSPRDLSSYVPSLRLTLTPFAVRLTDPSQVARVDHLMYHRTFKGVIDAVARYGYYHLVRWMTRQLSRTALPPNLFTLLSIAGIWIAVPCFAAGHLAAGAVAAWSGVLLDSIDGKLARLTLHLSEAMGKVEHVTATSGLLLWFAALGWHFSGGELLANGPLAVTTWILLGSCALDKIASGLFRKRFGRELFDYRKIDARFHLIAARRNIHLLMLTAGVALDLTEEAFTAMAGWMVATLLFHAGRFGWTILADRGRSSPAR
jgi:hypothetical protein